MEKTEHRFRYRGQAIGVAPVPGHDIIEPQAAIALPWIGGHHSADIKNFQDHKYVRFDRAHSVVLGSRIEDPDGAFFGTVVQATVEGLNIFDMITADRVVARVAAKHTGKRGDQPSVKLVGSRFENLRIAGVPVKLDLAIRLFDEHDTYDRLSKAYAPKKSSERSAIDVLALKPRPQNVHPKISDAFPELPEDGSLPRTLSLVRSITPEYPLFACQGHIIYVEGFGVIRLAELQLHEETRAVTMLRVDFGSPPRGSMLVCAADDGGLPF